MTDGQHDVVRAGAVRATGPRYFAAVDLGASSGRVILGRLADGRFELEETIRFPNGPMRHADGGLHTDIPRLISEVHTGIERAMELSGGRLESIGVDAWGVDYGRVDAAGELLEDPFHYRDERTSGVPDLVFSAIRPDELYSLAGLQVMVFNTIFQLVAGRAGDWSRVDKVLMIPDLFSNWLCGRPVAEMTAASTTGLLDIATRTWSERICRQLAATFGLPVPQILPELVEPGTVIGTTRPGLFTTPVNVVAVCGHDTASAVVAVPAKGADFGFISSGTWSLVGLEVERPVLSEASRRADFTNELGADGTVRYLRNVTGLWTLNEAIRTWQAAGRSIELGQLISDAAQLPGLSCVLDMTDPRLLSPGDIPSRLREMAKETRQELADEPPAICRCILDSLAISYRRVLRQACELAGRQISTVHIVGGGSRNTLLCQLTAEATGLPVIAGPAEGTALGNLLIQARSAGAISGGLDALRRVALASSELVTYHPGGISLPKQRWDDAENSNLPRLG